MSIIKFIGMDVHKKSISIAIADDGRNGQVRHYGTLPNDLDALDKFCRKMVSTASQLHFVYEAGPCGYDLYRHLTGKGFDCKVVAPSMIPRKSGDRIKTDRCDARMLARLHRAGELTAVYMPDEQDEAMNLRKVDVAQFYPKISCPVLILKAPEGLLADDDILLPEEVLERMLAQIPDARSFEVKGANHYTVMFQANESRDQVIREFLRG